MVFINNIIKIIAGKGWFQSDPIHGYDILLAKTPNKADNKIAEYPLYVFPLVKLYP